MTIPDVLPAEPGFRVLFCGFTPRQLSPAEQHLLPSFGLGITNVAPRPTARADELTTEELVAGGRRLASLVLQHEPAWLAVVGITAYRTAFAHPRATMGRQDHAIGPTHVWVLPNPSGLNAHYTLPRLTTEFAALRAAVRTVS